MIHVSADLSGPGGYWTADAFAQPFRDHGTDIRYVLTNGVRTICASSRYCHVFNEQMLQIDLMRFVRTQLVV